MQGRFSPQPEKIKPQQVELTRQNSACCLDKKNFLPSFGPIALPSSPRVRLLSQTALRVFHLLYSHNICSAPPLIATPLQISSPKLFEFEFISCSHIRYRLPLAFITVLLKYEYTKPLCDIIRIHACTFT
jgi:hypothetical protein